MPSYNISDGWNNPYYEDWLKAGGWKDSNVNSLLKLVLVYTVATNIFLLV